MSVYLSEAAERILMKFSGIIILKLVLSDGYINVVGRVRVVYQFVVQVTNKHDTLQQ